MIRNERDVPRAFNSLQACSQALASRDVIYTFAPLATNPSEIPRPMPFAPPVTRTTLPLTSKRVAASILKTAKTSLRNTTRNIERRKTEPRRKQEALGSAH